MSPRSWDSARLSHGTTTGRIASRYEAFSGFSTDEAATVRSFYEDTLGLRVSEADGMLTLHLGGGTDVLVYPRGPEHAPATFTVLNFQVSDVEATVDDLTARGVQFERYEGTPVETVRRVCSAAAGRSSPGSPIRRATSCGHRGMTAPSDAIGRRSVHAAGGRHGCWLTGSRRPSPGRWR